jgi:hypothetical protein
MIRDFSLLSFIRANRLRSQLPTPETPMWKAAKPHSQQPNRRAASWQLAAALDDVLATRTLRWRLVLRMIACILLALAAGFAASRIAPIQAHEQGQEHRVIHRHGGLHSRAPLFD